MTTSCSRRKFLGVMGATAGMLLARPLSLLADTAPVGRVAAGMCPEYGTGVLPTMATMFDQLGGLDKLVRGKTVAVKLNLTGMAYDRLRHLPPSVTHWVHPDVIGATVRLLAKAGASKVRLLESPTNSAEPLEEFMLSAGWEPRDFQNLGTRVEFENTNFLGYGKKYTRFMVPGNALMYKGYDLNHSYEDCDVFVSLAKMKEHITAGITLSLKNCFGITPCTIYGEGSGEDEPSLIPKGGRGPFHAGNREPSKSAPQMINPNGPKEGGYRVPRIVADLVAARPIHLCIVDGIQAMTGGEGPWTPGRNVVKPGLLVAGTNGVNTDAVCMALMGFDPMADRGTPPFETADSTLRLAEGLGVGSRDLKRIEVVGTPIAKGRFNFRRA
ncbi:MAG TPA: DUF362 domain-containing protein [Terriglobia bacterium]|nr:DUF362 domain-containing protein [Terriglobia bacterium]